MATSLGTLYSKTPGSSYGIHGAKIKIKLYETKWSAGKTKVSWTIDLIGRSTSPTKATTKINLTISTNGKKITDITGISYNSGSEIISYNNNTGVLSGSCYIFHNDDGTAKVTVALDGSIAGHNVDNSGSYSLTKNLPYTKCTAPTKIEINKTIIIPNNEDKITIKWSGASGGVSNAIKSYKIYYRYSSAGEKPTTSSDSILVEGASTSQYEFTAKIPSSLNNNGRGYKLIFGIVVQGSAGSDYYSSMKYSNAITINSLPDSPVVTVNGLINNIVPSTTETVEIVYKAGDDSDDNLQSENKKVYWSTSSDFASASVAPSSPITIDANNNITYYFWTYDGLEYSEKTKVKIIKNKKPTFNVSLSGTKLRSSNNNTLKDYIVSPTINLTEISGGQANKTYTYTLYYGGAEDNLESYTLASGLMENQYTIDDIRKHINGYTIHQQGTEYQNNGAYYKIGVTCFDTVETSDEVMTELKYVTKIPDLKALYNKANYGYVDNFYEGTKATYCSKVLGFEFYQDEGYDSIKCQFKINDEDGLETKINLTTDDNGTRGEWIEAGNITSGNQNVSYQFSYKNTSFSSDDNRNFNIYKIDKISIENPIIDEIFKNYKIFTSQGAYGGNFKNPFIDTLKSYGIADKLNSSNFGVKISANKQAAYISGSPNDVSNDNTISFLLNSSSLFTGIIGIFNSNERNSAYESSMQFYIRNDFGDEYLSENLDFTIDFKEQVEITKSSICPPEVTINEKEESYSIDKWKYLKEGMTLIGNFEIKSYNTNPKGKIQIQRSTDSSSWQNLTEFNFSKVKNEDGSEPHAEHSKPVKYTASDEIIQQIAQISTLNYNVNYRIIIDTDSGESTEELLYENILVLGHIPPILSIQNSTFKTEGNVTALEVNYQITNPGVKIKDNEDRIIAFVTLKDNKVNLLWDEKTISFTDNNLNYFGSGDNKTAIFNGFKFEAGQESALVKLSVTTQFSTYLIEHPNTSFFTTEKTTNLNEIVATAVFNILPTVAYRKNHLGINILEPSTNKNSIITIGEAPGRDTIYFQSANKNFCKIDNFLVDGDSWDGTSGGLAGSKPPDNLARIAYTGEIGDLNQTNKEIVIIISGGTASNYF